MHSTDTLLKQFDTPLFVPRLKELYGPHVDSDLLSIRYKNLIYSYIKHYGINIGEEVRLYSTPGRTELAGNHTDHNHGKVIAASIQLDTIAAAAQTAGSFISLISEGFPPVVIDISDLSVHPDEHGTTHALVRGIVAGFASRGFEIGAFRAVTTSNVLKGSGLSSSAAIEMLCATIINDMYNDNRMSVVDMAIVSQEAENRWFGKPCGLMDQIACGYGGIVEIDFANDSDPVVEHVQGDFQAMGYDVVIVDTRADHAGLTEEYAAIPAEMGQVAALFGCATMRQVELESFITRLASLRGQIANDRALLRAYHFLQENERVDHMAAALRDKDIERYVKLVALSGDSSFKYLQNISVNGQPHRQDLAVALAASEAYLDGSGASRVHGGGFAGTIQAYVPHGRTLGYVTAMEDLFGPGCTTVVNIRGVPTTRVL